MGEEKKEQLEYEIRTEGFERILLALQHITQRIKKGEKCIATIEYDPDAPFTKITTIVDYEDDKSAFKYSPRGLKTMILDSEKQKVVFDVMSLFKMKELSVREANEILKAVSSEIHIIAMTRKR